MCPPPNATLSTTTAHNTATYATIRSSSAGTTPSAAAPPPASSAAGSHTKSSSLHTNSANATHVPPGHLSHLSAQVQVQLSHHQAVPAARQAGRAAGIGRSHIAAAVKVAKVLQRYSSAAAAQHQSRAALGCPFGSTFTRFCSAEQLCAAAATVCCLDICKLTLMPDDADLHPR